MELPFDIINILESIEHEPGILVAYAAFHPFAILLLFVPLWIFKKIGFYKPKDNLGLFGFSITMIIIIGWLMGFVSQIVLLFMGVSGLKLLFIYLSMYLCIIFYVIFNGISLQKKFLKETNKSS
jgi:hypothetical protein